MNESLITLFLWENSDHFIGTLHSTFSIRHHDEDKRED